MTPATQLRAVTAHLWEWSGFHAQWKVDFVSHALNTPEGVVFLDPLKPAPAVLARLKKLGEPIAIVLTNANHDRDADWFRKKFGIEIYAHEKAPPECGVRIDVPVLDGEKLPGGLQTIHLPGSAAGEIALFSKLDGGVVVIGDTLLNPAGKGLALLPDEYIEDRKLALRSLHKLLDLKFKTAVFAHSAPLLGTARQTIADFLNPPKKEINLMSKQYNKGIKRKRRNSYLKRAKSRGKKPATKTTESKAAEAAPAAS